MTEEDKKQKIMIDCESINHVQLSSTPDALLMIQTKVSKGVGAWIMRRNILPLWFSLALFIPQSIPFSFSGISDMYIDQPH